MDSNEIHKHEMDYWDKQISKVIEDRSYNYKKENLQGHEELFSKIDYLKPIVDFWGDISNKNVLDLACGDGWISLSLGKSGAFVYGFDISPKRVAVAKKYAEMNDLNDRIKFETMVSEKMTYDDNFFDFAIMHAALHHCDIEETSKQIHRVLKPGGKAVLIEDYAYHPLMNFYRLLTPDKHTKTEKALTDEDLEIVVSRFSKHFYKYYGLFNLFETSNNPLISKLKPFIRSLDNCIYNVFPSSKRYSKLVEMFIVK